MASETLVPISGFAAKELPCTLENCVWFWVKSSGLFLSLTCCMVLDKSLNLSVTYFPICKMRLIIIFAYFTKVLEE